MRKNLFLFLTAASLLTLASVQTAIAQNGTPYWSTFGNSNATSTSKLGTTNAINLRLFTSNVERVRITTSGLVGIGTTAPNARLHFDGPVGTSLLRGTVAGSTKLYMSSAGGLTVGSGTAAPANGLYVAGNVGIGTSTPAYKLQVIGTSSFSAQLTVGNGGVYGYNSSGPGVYARGSSYGVYATSTGSYGVYSSGATYGLYGLGTYCGIYGSASGSSTYGSITYGGYIGSYGNGSTYGVYGYGGAGGSNAGVYGYTPGGNSESGVYGYNGSYGYGLRGYSVYGSGVYAQGGAYAGYFVGKVYSSGGYTSSDKKLKKDIKDLTSAMDLINQLHPKSYTFRQDGNYKLMNLPVGQHFGLIAQDVEQILPNLVSDAKFDPQMAKPEAPVTPGTTPTQATTQSSEVIDFKALNYTELIPIVIKGMQEQAELIKQQQLQIDDLKAQVSRITGGGSTLTGMGSLGQNTPNPVRTSTRIAYSVPSGVNHAQLLLTDNGGKTIKAVSLSPGSNAINLNTMGLSSGIYNYSLMIDGTIVETKKMEVVRNQ